MRTDEQPPACTKWEGKEEEDEATWTKNYDQHIEGMSDGYFVDV